MISRRGFLAAIGVGMTNAALPTPLSAFGFPSAMDWSTELEMVDGVMLYRGATFLMTGQSDSTTNGVYRVSAVGSWDRPFVLERVRG